MVLTIGLALVVLAIAAGSFGVRHGYGYWGWSPLGLLLLAFVILALTGNLAGL